MITKTQFIALLLSRYAYNEKLVTYIDEENRGHQLIPSSSLPSYDAYYAAVQRLLTERKYSIKAERLERYNETVQRQLNELARERNHTGPVTMHGFLAFPGSPSFDLHIDPYPVLIRCIEGTKTMMIKSEIVEIPEGSEQSIPAYELHQATNKHDVFTLSIGFERFVEENISDELDDICQNHRDV